MGGPEIGAYWSFDAATFAALAAVTLAEGVRRVPAGSHVLRRVPGYSWRVATVPAASASWQLVSWWSPLTLTVVLPPPADGPAPERGGAHPVPTAAIRVLRALGAAVLLGLVVGVPLLTANYGVWGLAYALAAALLGSLAVAATLAAALAAQGVARRTYFREAGRCLSPFSSPRAAEVLLERVLGEMPAHDAVRWALSPSAFEAWARPIAFDQLADGQDGPLPAGLAGELVAKTPPECREGESFCRRCGGVYGPPAQSCAGCGVPLAPGPPGPPGPAGRAPGAPRPGRGLRKRPRRTRRP